MISPGYAEKDSGPLQGFSCAPGPVAFDCGTGSHQRMSSSRRDPLPRGIVRDLLGITRALYRAELALPPAEASRQCVVLRNQNAKERILRQHGIDP